MPREKENLNTKDIIPTHRKLLTILKEPVKRLDEMKGINIVKTLFFPIV